MTNPIYTYSLEIPFYDVDTLRIAWHGNYVKYLEEARCAWLKAVGYTYIDMEKAGYLFPIVRVELKYLRPARFGQKVFVQLFLRDFETALKIDYRIETAEGELLTKAYTMQAAVKADPFETQYQTPAAFQAAIQAYLEKIQK